MVTRVCFPFVGDSVGGSHISAGQLIQALDRTRFEPVVTLHQRGPAEGYLRELGVPYQLVAVPGLAAATPSLASIASAQGRGVSALVPFLKREQIGIVHSNDLRIHLTWSPAARLAGSAHVWHQRVLLSRSPLWRLIPWAASRVVCISDAVRATLPGRRDNVRVVRDPVAAAPRLPIEERARLRSELGVPPGVVLVGFVGNMLRQKRPHAFVEAAAQVVAQGADGARFVLFGDNRGGELESVQALVRERKLAEHVVFAGYRRPIDPWLAALDVLAAPGVGDAFGRTLVEAMLAGVAVVAVASGGHTETIKDGATGLLVPPEDAAALASGLLRLLRDRTLLRRLVDAGQAYARHEFAPANHASKVEAIYAELLPRPSGSGRLRA